MVERLSQSTLEENVALKLVSLQFCPRTYALRFANHLTM